MFDNYILPFLSGFIIVIIPLILFCLFILFLVLTLGAWNNFEKADSLKNRAMYLFFFFMIQLIIIVNLNELIGPEILDSLDLNSEQMISCYCGFVVFIVITRKKFGRKILDATVNTKE